MTIVAWIYPTSSNSNQIFMNKGVWILGFFELGAVIFSHVCGTGQVQAYTTSNSVPFKNRRAWQSRSRLRCARSLMITSTRIPDRRQASRFSMIS